ncbi:hypothetical protein BLNAU_13751 [Blattamonas nauphoetae]|uniref:Uncharacterized protein n=1 Tax=Blattamonas nauphoetae TaxID=2049346 RepID=A0ABQ9XKB3_9EUKA|nr:hypothetical protein BLNAU_13751 [Blattamonas nauphoetae]
MTKQQDTLQKQPNSETDHNASVHPQVLESHRSLKSSFMCFLSSPLALQFEILAKIIKLSILSRHDAFSSAIGTDTTTVPSVFFQHAATLASVHHPFGHPPQPVQSVVFVDGNGDPLRECSQLTQQVAAFARVLVLSIHSLPLCFNLFKKPVVETFPVSVLNSLFRSFVTLTKENQFFVENNRLDGMFTHTFPQLIFFLFHSKHFHLFKLCLKMFIGCLELESNNYVLKDLTATSSLAKNTKERSKQGIDSDDATFDPSSFNNNGEMIIALFEHLLSEIRRLADYDVAARKAASDVSFSEWDAVKHDGQLEHVDEWGDGVEQKEKDERGTIGEHCDY